MSYTFWNKFVEQWMAISPDQYVKTESVDQPEIEGWKNPNLTKLLNNTTKKSDFSLQYLPEPWWGNNGVHVLNSVVINYNPGPGEEIQHYSHSSGLFDNTNYQSFANNEATGATNHFKKTNKWHREQRAQRIFSTLSRIGITLHENQKLENHLSIELIPWHTQGISTIGKYIDANLRAIFDNCITFAATESLRINNTKLKGKVILRLSGDMTTKLLKRFDKQGICTYTIINPIGDTPSKKGSFFKFKINSFPNVVFISIWGRRRRNRFPVEVDMDWIFTNII